MFCKRDLFFDIKRSSFDGPSVRDVRPTNNINRGGYEQTEDRALLMQYWVFFPQNVGLF
jgi:hypothetical protein